MKALRYLLITFMVVMASVQMVNAKAQSLAQEPQMGFQSTSSMVGSGSTLPQAANTGAYTTYDVKSSGGNNSAGIRKGLGGGGGPEDRPEPYNDPIGDGGWAMVALACCYAAFAAWRKRKEVASQR